MQEIYVFFLRKLYSPKPYSISELIDMFSKKTTNLTVVQVGANDGFNNDPIFKFILRDSWNGVLIEPQTHMYHTYLKKLYANSTRIHTLNAAIGNEDGTLPLYKISFSEERWATGLATFDKEGLLKMVHDGSIDRRAEKYGIPVPASKSEYITEEYVIVVSPKTLQQRYSLETIDFLMVDTEGFDYEIVKMFLNAQFVPKLIVFEHFHFSEQEWLDCELLLQKYNYLYLKIKGNTFAILNTPDYSDIHQRMAQIKV